jgi:hypothetical protein
MKIDDRRERPHGAFPLSLFLSLGKAPTANRVWWAHFPCCTAVQGAPCRLRALRHSGRQRCSLALRCCMGGRVLGQISCCCHFINPRLRTPLVMHDLLRHTEWGFASHYSVCVHCLASNYCRSDRLYWPRPGLRRLQNTAQDHQKNIATPWSTVFFPRDCKMSKRP